MHAQSLNHTFETRPMVLILYIHMHMHKDKHVYWYPGPLLFNRTIEGACIHNSYYAVFMHYYMQETILQLDQAIF